MSSVGPNSQQFFDQYLFPVTTEENLLQNQQTDRNSDTLYPSIPIEYNSQDLNMRSTTFGESPLPSQPTGIDTKASAPDVPSSNNQVYSSGEIGENDRRGFETNTFGIPDDTEWYETAYLSKLINNNDWLKAEKIAKIVLQDANEIQTFALHEKLEIIYTHWPEHKRQLNDLWKDLGKFYVKNNQLDLAEKAYRIQYERRENRDIDLDSLAVILRDQKKTKECVQLFYEQIDLIEKAYRGQYERRGCRDINLDFSGVVRQIRDQKDEVELQDLFNEKNRVTQRYFFRFYCKKIRVIDRKLEHLNLDQRKHFLELYTPRSRPFFSQAKRQKQYDELMRREDERMRPRANFFYPHNFYPSYIYKEETIVEKFSNFKKSVIKTASDAYRGVMNSLTKKNEPVGPIN